MSNTELSTQLPDDLRDVAWTRAGARMAGGDKEILRLSPSQVFVPNGMTPRSHAVLDAVQSSMKHVGQLVPIIVTADGHELLDGATRLASAKLLDLPFVTAVTVADLEEWERLAIRLLTNSDTYRASFTVLEAVNLYNRYTALLGERAARNKSLNGGQRPHQKHGADLGLPNFGTPIEIEPIGSVAKASAEFVPYSHETIRKVNLIKGWAEDDALTSEAREVARRALEQIERTNKVNSAYRQAQEAAVVAAASEQTADTGEVSAQAWCDMELAISKAETLMRVDVAGVVAFGLQANDDHKVFLPRLAALREWIAAYERACQE